MSLCYFGNGSAIPKTALDTGFPALVRCLLKQTVILKMLAVAGSTGCSQERRDELLAMLERETFVPDGCCNSALSGMQVIVDHLFVHVLDQRPDKMMALCPVFMATCDTGTDVRALLEESVRNQGVIREYDVEKEVAKAMALGAKVPRDKTPKEMSAAIDRNTQIQIELERACRVSDDLKAHGHDAAFRSVLRTVWRSVIARAPHELIDLFPFFAMICGDRKSGLVRADIDWSLVR